MGSPGWVVFRESEGLSGAAVTMEALGLWGRRGDSGMPGGCGHCQEKKPEKSAADIQPAGYDYGVAAAPPSQAPPAPKQKKHRRPSTNAPPPTDHGQSPGSYWGF
ncbi:unnamed protein product, partial [Mesorhabditis spiculigera]